jgi:hypothetical protein
MKNKFETSVCAILGGLFWFMAAFFYYLGFIAVPASDYGEEAVAFMDCVIAFFVILALVFTCLAYMLSRNIHIF